MFPIEDLRQAVETAKRILTKEKLDRQLTAQTSTSPFLSIRDGINKKVSFNTADELGDKIDKLTAMLGNIGTIFKKALRGYRRQSSRGEYRNDRHDDYNRSRNRSRDRSFSGNYSSTRDRSSSNSRFRSGSRASTNRDRIRCYNCREYDHFARDCPTSREERDLEQLQQMLNLEEEEEQTHLLTCRQSSSTENGRTNPINLQMVRMAPLHSYLWIPR